MNEKTSKWIQTGILFGLGAYLLVKIFSGTLYYYINQRFLWLVAVGAVVFIVLAIVSIPKREAAHEHDHVHEHDHAPNWRLLVVALPLALGFLVPARPLDSSALESRGLTTNALLGSAQGVQLEAPSDERSVLDWIRAFNFATDPSIYEGERADVIGFVYHDERLEADQFLVSRFAVSCCVADAFAIGMIVEASTAADWAGNTWVHVTGSIGVGSLDGDALPLITAESIKEVPVPPQPYLFP